MAHSLLPTPRWASTTTQLSARTISLRSASAPRAYRAASHSKPRQGRTRVKTRSADRQRDSGPQGRAGEGTAVAVAVTFFFVAVAVTFFFVAVAVTCKSTAGSGTVASPGSSPGCTLAVATFGLPPLGEPFEEGQARTARAVKHAHAARQPKGAHLLLGRSDGDLRLGHHGHLRLGGRRLGRAAISPRLHLQEGVVVVLILRRAATHGSVCAYSPGQGEERGV